MIRDCNQMTTTITEYIDGLYSYAMILTQDYANAEDLVHQTYLHALSGTDYLQGKKTKDWLFKTLRRVWLVRRTKQRNGLPVNEIDAHSCNRYQGAHVVKKGITDEERVRLAIHRLPIESRELILLREFENLSYFEIANVLDCSKGAVISQLTIARSSLRLILTSG